MLPYCYLYKSRKWEALLFLSEASQKMWRWKLFCFVILVLREDLFFFDPHSFRYLLFEFSFLGSRNFFCFPFNSSLVSPFPWLYIIIRKVEMQYAICTKFTIIFCLLRRSWLLGPKTFKKALTLKMKFGMMNMLGVLYALAPYYYPLIGVCGHKTLFLLTEELLWKSS